MMPAPAGHGLQALLNRRIAECQRFAGDADLGGDDQVALVVSRLDLAAIVRGTLRLCSALPRDVARPWAGNFTKCLVLAGEPRKLAARFPLAHVEGDGAVAWVGPNRARELDTLRRLLRPLKTLGALDLPDLTVAIDAAAPVSARSGLSPRRAVVTLATGGLRLEDYLVCLEHTLAEAALLGHLDGVEMIAVRHVDTLEAVASASTYARVHKGRPGDPTLRLYATVAAALD